MPRNFEFIIDLTFLAVISFLGVVLLGSQIGGIHDTRIEQAEIGCTESGEDGTCERGGKSALHWPVQENGASESANR